jgi:hypothetical protein
LPDGKRLAYLQVPNIHNRLPFTAVRKSNPWSIRIWNKEKNIREEVWKTVQGAGSVFFNEIPVGGAFLWWARDNQLIFPYEKEGWQQLYALDLSTKKRLPTPGKAKRKM